MATAKKLPSGNWRVQVYSHTGSDGKKHKISFTATSKAEAELLASQWRNKNDRKKQSDLTVYEAIEGYIIAKKGVLSPSTIRGYDKMLRNNYEPIKNKHIKKLTSEDLQLFISDLSIEGKSPKSVANIYGLLSASISLYLPDCSFKVTLPTKIKKRLISPSDGDIQLLYNSAAPELKKCIALSAFGSMRRGEICALTFGDIEGNIIHITKDVVQDVNNKWCLKDIPKTSDSIRDIYVPDEILILLGTGSKKEKIINYANPGSITQCFTKLRNKLNVNIHFHQLRSYYASIGAVLGIPTNYLEDFGGWRRGSGVMKEVYQNSITSKSKEYARKMADHFSGLIVSEKNVPTKVPTTEK